jgi:hypothetical protein
VSSITEFRGKLVAQRGGAGHGVIGRQNQPSQRADAVLRNPAPVDEQDRELGRRFRDAGPRGSLVERGGHHGVRLRALAPFQECGQVVLRLGQPLVGRGTVPAHGACRVDRTARARLEQGGQLELGEEVALLGGTFVPIAGRRRVGPGLDARFMKYGQTILRLDKTRFRRALVPTEAFTVIGWQGLPPGGSDREARRQDKDSHRGHVVA